MNPLLLRRRYILQQLNSTEQEDPYLSQPFTIVVKQPVQYTFIALDATELEITTLKYKINDGNWVNVNLSDTEMGVNLPSVSVGDKIQIISDGPWKSSTCYFGFDNGSFRTNVTGGYCDLEGNLMSLVGGDNFINCTNLPDYAFYGGIGYDMNSTNNNSYIVGDISNLRIPATTIGSYALAYAFTNNTNLTGDITKLFQSTLTTIDTYGCRNMFYGCTNLNTIPLLSATTINNYGCYGMFYQTAISETPEIIATSIGTYCFTQMFQNCTNLTKVTSTLPATTLKNHCYRQMFSGCTNITTAPVLPAQTLVSNCYRQMFDGCSKLNYIKAMFTTTPTTTYTNNWVRNVASSGTFVKNSSATWATTGAAGIPSGWTVQTASS